MERFYSFLYIDTYNTNKGKVRVLDKNDTNDMSESIPLYVDNSSSPVDSHSPSVDKTVDNVESDVVDNSVESLFCEEVKSSVPPVKSKPSPIVDDEGIPVDKPVGKKVGWTSRFVEKLIGERGTYQTFPLIDKYGEMSDLMVLMVTAIIAGGITGILVCAYSWGVLYVENIIKGI